MRRNIFLTSALAISLGAAVTLSGCHKDDDDNKKNSEPEVAYTSNDLLKKFVYETFGVYYYWDKNVPESINLDDFETPYDVFESFRDESDRFSTVINSYSEWTSSLDGDYKTDGLVYDLYLAEKNSNNVIGLVTYVYDNSPAKKAGMERGFVINAVNGVKLTRDNLDLLDANEISYTYTKIYETEDGISWDGEEFTSAPIAKGDLNVDPVLIAKTIEKGGKKIGYFLYDSFTSDKETIINAMKKLKNEGATELVVDLRLNGGGLSTTLDTLASMIVPAGNVGKVFLEEEYNSLLTSEFKKYYGDDFNVERFTDVEPNMGLSTVYILTSGNSASASEELISGLKPYMNVVIIGETTYGKFTTNYMLNDEDDLGRDDEGIELSEWACYVSVAINRNANKQMDFVDGFEPDYEIFDTYKELGTENDPLLAKALDLITGSISKSARKNVGVGTKKIGFYGKPEILKGGMVKKLRLLK